MVITTLRPSCVTLAQRAWTRQARECYDGNGLPSVKTYSFSSTMIPKMAMSAIPVRPASSRLPHDVDVIVLGQLAGDICHPALPLFQGKSLSLFPIKSDASALGNRTVASPATDRRRQRGVSARSPDADRSRRNAPGYPENWDGNTPPSTRLERGPGLSTLPAWRSLPSRNCPGWQSREHGRAGNCGDG
jgi:hypothetical protein